MSKDSLRKLAKRVERILEDARDREKKGQRLELEIAAGFKLTGQGVVQFQVACAILEETQGMTPEEVVTEFLVIGIDQVLKTATLATMQSPIEHQSGWTFSPEEQGFNEDYRVLN